MSSRHWFLCGKCTCLELGADGWGDSNIDLCDFRLLLYIWELSPQLRKPVVRSGGGASSGDQGRRMAISLKLVRAT